MSQGETYQQDQSRASRVTLTGTDDSGDQQLLNYKGVSGEEHSGVMRIQYFGWSSHAPAGSEAVVLALGNRDMLVAIGAESPSHKPTGLPEGGTRLYDASGSYVDMDNAGNITVNCSGTLKIKAATVIIESPDINLGGEGGVPVAKQGTTDTAGHANVGNLASTTKIV